jgi:putative colanic acid biosynthesis UDP-glucose lipid carrier transferase
MYTPVRGTTTLLRRTAIASNTNLRTYFETKRRYHIWKRTFDLGFSIFAIVFIFSWLFPLIALLIKLDSRGPVFFIQRRVGFLGRTFKCLKFRTMVVNKEANWRMATKNDPRITRIGILLRKSNLDELPQFFNVLLGQMSIVGPRPHMHKDCCDFSRVVPFYKFRNFAKPGITGLAQSKGFRGPAKDFLSIFHRYQWDAFYVRNANFWLDIRLVRKTATQTIYYVWLKSKETFRNLWKQSDRIHKVRIAYREMLSNLNGIMF